MTPLGPIEALNAICGPLSLPMDVRAITLRASVDELPTLEIERVVMKEMPIGKVSEVILERFDLRLRCEQEPPAEPDLRHRGNYKQPPKGSPSGDNQDTTE